jgi:CheY-like chemotaxis protein
MVARRHDCCGQKVEGGVVSSPLSARDPAGDADDQVQRIFEAQRLESLGHLAGGIAHDFNNLLGVIINYATLVARQVSDPVVSADVAEIRAAAERGAGLTRQLLTFARRDVVHPEQLDVSSVVHSMASLFERTLGEHIDLRLDLGAQPVVALCDRTQFEQILLNLAINARDAMTEGGVLGISVRCAEPGVSPVLLTVTDGGHGMSAEVLAHAFEPFFTTKPRGHGTGLGLASVYGIVTQNGGQISLESVPGEGTTVTVRLPSATSVGSAEQPRPPATHGGSERILLVEDKKALRIVTARLLRESGYDVLVAADGVEALDLLHAGGGNIDVVLTDVAMPRMRGDELARQIRDRAYLVPIIFMTGYDSGAAPGGTRVLTKPVAEEVLLEAIREALENE